jgi:flagellar protein FlgJ
MSSSSRAEFIRRALEAADRARAEGAPIVPEIAAAQAALESRYGESRLAIEANNLFGIKAGRSWQGPILVLPTNEYVDGQPVLAVARWRKYASWQECLRDYGNLLELLPWFADAAAAARRGDTLGFLDGLLFDPHGPGTADDEPGWATDPHYRDKVLSVARRWGLLG